MKRRKPDILLILAFSVGLGVLVTGYAQNFFHHDSSLETSQPASDKTRKFDNSSHGELATKIDKSHRVNN